MSNEIVLEGCRPVPMASYLKGLGAFRVLAEHFRDTRAAWRADRLVLWTSATEDELVDFFADEYVPAAILAPWNGGSGFHPKDNTDAFAPIAQSTAARFSPLATTIEAARQALARLGLDEKPDSNTKSVLLELCRALFPDDGLRWLDAAYVLTGDDPRFPPLLGTGGNDGRLDFTNNYLQRLVMVLDPLDGRATASSRSWLRSALFDAVADGFGKDTMGQFEPAAVTSNPWNYVLMLEGSLLFAAASARALNTETRGYAYPFTVRQTAAGYGSAASTDESESRGEIWMPMWSRPTSCAEVEVLFSEGRARLGRRPAQDGIDFARAASSYGVDRGIDQFQRYGFQVRNGLAYLATDHGRFTVGPRPETTLISSLETSGWLDRFRSRVRSKNTPNAIASVAMTLDTDIFRLLEHGRHQDVLATFITLGRVEQALARSVKWASEKGVRPIPPLDANWLKRAYAADSSTELRVAAALATLGTKWAGSRPPTTLRNRLEPIKGHDRLSWQKQVDTPDVVRHSGSMERTLLDIIERQLIDHSRWGVVRRPGVETHWVDRSGASGLHANNTDVRAFVDGLVDDRRLYDLMWSCALVDLDQDHVLPAGSDVSYPDAAYALLKLGFAGRPLPRTGTAIPVVAQVPHLAAAGRVDAVDVAQRRLRASGVAPLRLNYTVQGSRLRRICAALLIPISSGALRELEDRVLDDQNFQTQPTQVNS